MTATTAIAAVYPEEVDVKAVVYQLETELRIVSVKTQPVAQVACWLRGSWLMAMRLVLKRMAWEANDMSVMLAV